MAYQGNNSTLDALIFQDVTRSVDQLCTQLSLTNINVPKYSRDTDVYEFINEFEAATAALNESQKVKVLPKSFLTSKYRSWFETELSPEIAANKDWKTIKTRIIKRFSDSEDRDRHFVRLRELKYDPESDQRLLDFVEEIWYSYMKAYPDKLDMEEAIRFVKASIPKTIRLKLETDSQYRDATCLEDLRRAIRQFDTGSVKEKKATNSDLTELASALKDLVSGIKKEGETTRGAIAAALQSRHETSSYRPTRRDVSPRRVTFNHNVRGASPSYRRSPSSMNYGQRQVQQENVRRSPEPIRKTVASNDNIAAFDSDYYFKKFGRPPAPCTNCGFLHWMRHCHQYLNE